MSQLIATLFLFLSFTAAAEPAAHKVLMSLTDQQKNDPSWSERTCARAFNNLQKSVSVSATCLNITSQEIGVGLDPRVQRARSETNYDLYMHVHRVNENETWVRVMNFNQSEDA